MEMINLRTVLQWRDASKPSLSFKLWTGWRRGGWCDLMLIKPIIKYRHHITHSTAASSQHRSDSSRSCWMSIRSWGLAWRPPPPVQWDVWLGGTKSSAGWFFCFSQAAINLNIWIKLSDPKAALAKGNILRGKNMNTLARGVGRCGDKSWLECWRCHFTVKTRTNWLTSWAQLSSALGRKWSPIKPCVGPSSPALHQLYICLSVVIYQELMWSYL